MNLERSFTGHFGVILATLSSCPFPQSNASGPVHQGQYARLAYAHTPCTVCFRILSPPLFILMPPSVGKAASTMDSNLVSLPCAFPHCCQSILGISYLYLLRMLLERQDLSAVLLHRPHPWYSECSKRIYFRMFAGGRGQLGLHCE